MRAVLIPGLRPGLWIGRRTVRALRLPARLGFGADIGLWILPIAGGSPRRLVAGMAIPVAWADDGTVYFVRGGLERSRVTQVKKVLASGGTPRLHIELPEGCDLRDLAVSRQADRFVCAVGEVESDVWVIDNFQ